LYQYLAPSYASIGLAKDLWGVWERDGVAPPDLDSIVSNTLSFEDGFFQDIVQVASKVYGQKLHIDYCPFILDDYKMCACTASDGYLVIIDETFFKMLFSMTNILMFEVNNLIEEDEEELFSDLIRNIINEFVEATPFKPFNRHSDKELSQLYERSYEISEFGVFLFQSFKIFILAHEISHHILQHTQGLTERHFSQSNNYVSIVIDKRSYESEFEADLLAYEIFRATMNTVDGSLKYAACIYRFEFAPLYLFDIFDKIDRYREEKDNRKIQYISHPSPNDRKKNLLNRFKISDTSILYDNLKCALDSYVR
jgi:hypothetical protein